MKLLLSICAKYRQLMRRGLGRRVALWLVLIGVVVMSGCSTGPVKPQVARAADAVPVTIATVVQKTVPAELEAIGNVEAYSTVSVKSQVEGALERVYFREGQDVKAGELLFTIDRRPFDAALQQAEANLARDTAQASHAKVEAERYTKLVEQGIVSKEQYDQYRTSAEAQDAAVRADKAAVENAQIQLGYCTIRSPIQGRAGSLLVHEGNVVKANDVPLVVLNRITPIYVNFAVPEKYLAEIKSRMTAGTLRVEASIPGDEAHPRDGTLSFVDNAVDATTGTIRLKGTFGNQDKQLWPGQFVNVKLRLAAQPNAVVVPSQAVQTGQQGQYVFVVKPDLTAEFRPVVVARSQGGEAVIERGLRPEEKVVTDGQLRLYPGAKMEVKSQ